MKDFTLFEFITAILTANITRYLVISGLFYTVYYVFFRKRWAFKKIQSSFPKPTDYQREIGYSLFTMCVFVGMALLVFRSPLRKYTLQYENVSTMGWEYWTLSVVMMIFIHDTYFYWTHRAMHHPFIYRAVHLVHHKSQNPSPWAAFAFHPLEAIVEAGILMVIAFTMPFHSTALLTFLLFMTIYNAYGHLGFELYPQGFNKTFIGKWMNTSIAHNQHHEKFTGNYGLYFLFWDRWMGTLREDYDTSFEMIDKKKNDLK